MKKIGLYVGIVAVLFTACNGEAPAESTVDSNELDTASFLSQINSIDSIMQTSIPEKKDINRAIVLYQEFANYFPEDTKTPNYLFQVSDFYLSQGKSTKAVNVLTNIISKYPNYTKLESVYFARASHVDLDLRDTTLAKRYYEEFLEMYPQSQYAADAKTRMENVGLSIEDIIKQFDEKNANK